MAKSSEVTSSSTSNSKTVPKDDDDYHSTNPEIVAFNKHVSNLQGNDKKYFGIVMTELADA